MDEKEILQKLSSQGIIDVRRIMRAKQEKTPAIILTFNRAEYPQSIKVGLLQVPTRPYYPNPLLCFKCYVYGHSRNNCPNPQRCFNCSAQHEEMDTCELPSFCVNCEKNHRPINRQCEVYRKEVDIIRTKIDFNLSYPDARKRVEAGNGSYAKVTAQPRLDKVRFDAMAEQIKKQQEIIEKMEQQLQNHRCLEEKVTEMLERSKEKDEKIEELMNHIQQREERIMKLEAQNHNLKCHLEGIQTKQRSESLTSEPNSETESLKRKTKRQTQPTDPQKPFQGSSGMSPPPKRTSSRTRSPIITRQMSSQEETVKSNNTAELGIRSTPPNN